MSAVQVDGLNDVKKALARVDPQVRKDLNRSLRNVGKSVAADAKQHAPFATGRLRKSIGVRSNQRGVSIVAKAPYAKLFEYGGRHPLFGNRERWVQQQARPFLTPARDAAHGRVEREVRQALETLARRF